MLLTRFSTTRAAIEAVDELPLGVARVVVAAERIADVVTDPPFFARRRFLGIA